jgi:hypothetical protein
LELNEVNFEFIDAYVRRGRLPTFASLIERFGYSQTRSEQEYENLEPWIQWVTAHTGKTLAEHGVFRLGDIDRLNGVEQIWERLERENSIRVGAVAPMNARNEISEGFFIPDPWTATPSSGPTILRKLSAAIGRIVNANAAGGLSASDAFWMAIGALANARLGNYPEYLRLVVGSLRRRWLRAIFLDLLLADTFASQVKRTRPGFASLFLNGAAHIQHHYLFSSPVYEGPHKNPHWYLPDGDDPLLAVYELYDRVVKRVLEDFPDHRVMIATGLHQDPHDEVTFYWRLREHARFLQRAGIPYRDVLPRMSRDFLVVCDGDAQAVEAEHKLVAITDMAGVPIFEVDNRGSDLFVMLTYPKEITGPFTIRTADGVVDRFESEVVFVALKNGKHNGIGYFIDTGARRDSLPTEFPLTELPDLIARAVADGAGVSA